MDKTGTVTEQQGQPMAEGRKVANGNGDGGRYLGIINSGAIALLIAIMAGFWSLADPRGEIKSIRDNYLSLREHNVFAERLQQDIARIDKAMNELNTGSVAQR